METDYLVGEELALMQGERGICISVIVPTHRLSPERRVDRIEVDSAIAKVKEHLRYGHTKAEVTPLLQSLDELYKQIDFNHNAEGIGLFVSSNIRKLVPFFFPVKEKLRIGNSFETRDLLYHVYYARPYLALLLTEKGAKLFQGRFDQLAEVKDIHFPAKHEDDYEYNRPVRGSSFVGHAFTKEFERDKTQLEELHYEDFLHHVDETLNSYIVDDTLLVLTGAKKDVAYFKKITKHTNIAGEILGNYLYMPINELGSSTWNIIRSFLDDRKQNLINGFEEKIGEAQGVTGITDVWKATKEGRGLMLLVEKDYSVPGYLINGDDYNLHLHPPKKLHEVMPDAVSSLIELVFEKNGDVVIVENGSLANYHGMALITRY